MAEIFAVTATRAANPFPESSASATGDIFENTGTEVLVIENIGPSDATVTVVTPETVDGLDVADKVITLAAGTRHLIGPFPKRTYNDATNRVTLNYSDHTNIRLAVAKLT